MTKIPMEQPEQISLDRISDRADPQRSRIRRTPGSGSPRPQVGGAIRTSLRSSFLVLLAAISAGRPADATIVRALTLEQKTAAATLVFQGRIERIHSGWEPDKRNIETLIEVRVIEAVKGPVHEGDLVIVRQSGGRIAEIEQRIEGMSLMQLGEECVLFLEPIGPYYAEIGIGIGKYSIEHSADPPSVHFASNVLELASDQTLATASPMPPEPLDRFLTRLRAFLKASHP